MRRRSVAAVTKVLQEDGDDCEEYEAPDEEVEERVGGHVLSDPMAARMAARMAFLASSFCQ